jgi:hypothetical protein
MLDVFAVLITNVECLAEPLADSHGVVPDCELQGLQGPITDEDLQLHDRRRNHDRPQARAGH